MSQRSIATEELSGVRVDVDEKIETFENLTPAELRNEEFRANRERKKGFLFKSYFYNNCLTRSPQKNFC